jgi:hypothetical protein
MGKSKQKGGGKGKTDSTVFKVAGIRKPKVKSVNTNLKKVHVFDFLLAIFTLN